eukprot:1676828-Amphidinium_carterae.1
MSWAQSCNTVEVGAQSYFRLEVQSQTGEPAFNRISATVSEQTSEKRRANMSCVRIERRELAASCGKPWKAHFGKVLLTFAVHNLSRVVKCKCCVNWPCYVHFIHKGAVSLFTGKSSFA